VAYAGRLKRCLEAQIMQSQPQIVDALYLGLDVMATALCIFYLYLVSSYRRLEVTLWYAYYYHLFTFHIHLSFRTNRQSSLLHVQSIAFVRSMPNVAYCTSGLGLLRPLRAKVNPTRQFWRYLLVIAIMYVYTYTPSQTIAENKSSTSKGWAAVHPALFVTHMNTHTSKPYYDIT